MTFKNKVKLIQQIPYLKILRYNFREVFLWFL